MTGPHRGRLWAIRSVLARHWYLTGWAIVLGYFGLVMWLGIPPDGLLQVINVPMGIAFLVLLYAPLTWKQESATPRRRGAIDDFVEGVGGCLAAIIGLALSLAGLVFFIWLVKRIWQAV
jgi:hypothetical protein